MHKPKRHTPAPGGFRIGFIIVGNVTSMLKVKRNMISKSKMKYDVPKKISKGKMKYVKCVVRFAGARCTVNSSHGAPEKADSVRKRKLRRVGSKTCEKLELVYNFAAERNAQKPSRIRDSLSLTDQLVVHALKHT